MSFTPGKRGIDEYKQFGKTSGIDEFTPHRLIQMLMEGALEQISMAIGMMQRNDIAGKGACISKAISIIEGLRTSLDKNAGGDIADNLDALYEYMASRLLEGNVHNNEEFLTEVAKLIIEIKSAWDQIPQDIIKQHADNVSE
ncbi:Flagellar biosynthesis protein FliS [hydrothermal vent metagenome]|uniref:Flagellar biosynthesis protein FliS n=1 Tax=hydrothermal vent metagenome TaxID=652676 RepID=A0A3B0Y2Q8_9ZZZZ